jgi:hypothetical protein
MASQPHQSPDPTTSASHATSKTPDQPSDEPKTLKFSPEEEAVSSLLVIYRDVFLWFLFHLFLPPSRFFVSDKNNRLY